MDSSERLENLPPMDARPFEQFIMLKKKSYRLILRRLSTRMNETMENTGSARHSVQRPASKICGTVAGASVLRERKCVERDESTLRVMECTRFSE